MTGQGPRTGYRIALANLPFASDPAQSVALAEGAVAQAGREGANIVCFPECFVPGYRIGRKMAPPDATFLRDAWSSVANAAKKANIGVILGTERVQDRGLLISALVIRPDGTLDGFQDKVQLDPSEEGTYVAGLGRRIFEIGGAKFGIAICHEGWRYPETVRWAARQGAQIVFHPQFHDAQADAPVRTSYGVPEVSFHEKAVLCRAAENTCFFATVNYAGAGSPTTSAIGRPDGSLLAFQPYGRSGLLIADLDLGEATGLLAHRYKPLV